MKYSRRVKKKKKKKKKLEESMKNESPKGTLGVFRPPFRDPPVASREEAKDEYSGSSQIRFPFPVSEEQNTG